MLIILTIYLITRIINFKYLIYSNLFIFIHVLGLVNILAFLWLFFWKLSILLEYLLYLWDLKINK